MNHTVYILYSENICRYYTGYTSDIEKRLELHKQPANNKFTYKADDWELCFTISCDSKIQALAIEKHIKVMKSKTYIQNLIKYPEMTTKLLEKYKTKVDQIISL